MYSLSGGLALSSHEPAHQIHTKHTQAGKVQLDPLIARDLKHRSGCRPYRPGNGRRLHRSKGFAAWCAGHRVFPVGERARIHVLDVDQRHVVRLSGLVIIRIDGFQCERPAFWLGAGQKGLEDFHRVKGVQVAERAGNEAFEFAEIDTETRRDKRNVARGHIVDVNVPIGFFLGRRVGALAAGFQKEFVAERLARCRRLAATGHQQLDVINKPVNVLAEGRERALAGHANLRRRLDVLVIRVIGTYVLGLGRLGVAEYFLKKIVAAGAAAAAGICHGWLHCAEKRMTCFCLRSIPPYLARLTTHTYTFFITHPRRSGVEV